jgi:hypothetical protein
MRQDGGAHLCLCLGTLFLKKRKKGKVTTNQMSKTSRNSFSTVLEAEV